MAQARTALSEEEAAIKKLTGRSTEFKQMSAQLDNAKQDFAKIAKDPK